MPLNGSSSLEQNVGKLHGTELVTRRTSNALYYYFLSDVVRVFNIAC